MDLRTKIDITIHVAVQTVNAQKWKGMREIDLAKEFSIQIKSIENNMRKEKYSISVDRERNEMTITENRVHPIRQFVLDK